MYPHIYISISISTHRWGWVRAVDSAACPGDVLSWRVWSKESASWLQDTSLEVRCAYNL